MKKNNLIFILIFLCTAAKAQLITMQPVNDTICQGSQAAFTCGVSLDADVFQWEHSTNNTNWNTITAIDPAYTGESTTTLQITNTMGLNNHWYRIVVTDSDPNPAVVETSNSAKLIINPNPNATIAPANPSFCAGSSVQLTAGGGQTYLWNTNATTAQIMVTVAGIYTVTATDGNGCSNTASKMVVQHNLPSVNITPVNPGFCTGSSVQLTATGGQSYHWNTNATTAQILVTVAGNYTVTATDGNGCSNTASKMVVQYNLPSALITPSNPAFCTGGTVQLTASGGQSYLWNTNELSPQITVSIAGTYTVTVTDVNGCTNTTSKAVIQNSLPTANISPSNPGFCTGSSVQLTASGGQFYLWSTNAATQQITVSAAGNYTVTVTDSNGCTNSTTKSVQQNNLPIATITPLSPNFCVGSSVQLTASGGLTYLWNNNATTPQITVSIPGTYSVTITDANGCSATSSKVVVQNTLPIAAISPGNPGFCTGSSVQLTASGGTSFNWSNGANSNQITVNAAGSYTVTVTDVNGCTNSSSKNVTQFNLPIANISPLAPTFCTGSSVQITASGGATYIWSNNAITPQISVNIPGTYTVTVTDINGCTSSVSKIVIQNNLPVPEISPSNPSLCHGSSVQLTASGGINYLWNNNMTGNQITASSPGNYTVTAVGANGCTATLTKTVVDHPNPTTSVVVKETSGILSNDSSVCAGEKFVLKASGAQSYQWQDLTNLDSLVVLSQFNNGAPYPYSVIGSITYADLKTCSNPFTGNVTVYDNPIADYSMSPNPITDLVGTGTNIFFTNESSSGQSSSPINSWDYNFADGTPPTASYSSNPPIINTHYAKAGWKQVNLMVKDMNGCFNNKPLGFQITGDTIPNVSVMLHEGANCIGDTVVLMVTITNSDKNNYRLLNYTEWPNQNTYTLIDTSTISFDEDKKFEQQAKIVFHSVGLFEVEVHGFQRTKNNPIPETPEGIAKISVHSGKNRPQISGLNPVSNAICSGEEIRIQINLNTNETTGFTYRVNNTGLPVLDSIFNGITTISFPSIGLQMFNLEILSLNLKSGCPNSDPDNGSVAVMIKPNPQLMLSDSAQICIGKLATLSVSGADSYEWKLNNQIINMNDSLDILVPAGSPERSEYYVVKGTKDDCSTIDSIKVKIKAPPHPTFEGDTMVCQGQVIEYSSQNSGGSLDWSTSTGNFIGGNKNDTATVKWLVDGTLSLKESFLGCDETKTVNVSVSNDEAAPYDSLVYLVQGKLLLCPNRGHVQGLHYQWRQNNVDLPGEKYQAVRLREPDKSKIHTYSVIVYFESDSITKNCAQEIRYRSNDQDILPQNLTARIVPNPTNGEFDILTETPIEGNFAMTIFDARGVGILKQQVFLNPGINHIPVALHQASSGLYYMHLRNLENGDQLTSAFVIGD